MSEPCACAPHLTATGTPACARHRTDGAACTGPRMAGVSVCYIHGRAPAIQRRVAATKVLRSLRVKHDGTNPLETLRGVGVDVLRWHEAMGAKAAALLDSNDLVYITSDDGQERIRAAVTLYERACDRSIKVYDALARLNIDERLCRIEAAKAAYVIGALEAAMEAAGCDIDQRERARVALVAELDRGQPQLRDAAG